LDNQAANEWYERVAPGDPLRQGEILPDFRILQATFRYVTGAPEIEASPTSKVIILSQSCDLFRPEKDSAGAIRQNILIAPLVPFAKPHVKNADKYAKGKMTQYHLLPANEAFAMEYSIVAFPLVTSVPYDAVKAHADVNSCIRLKSPYLEDLAMRFGVIFQRVALPEPPFDAAGYDKMIRELKQDKTPTT
jgi:hypothetical protein